MATKTKQVPFTKDQERWYREACEHLDGSRLRRLLMDLINVHSPTGLECQASEFMAAYQREHLGGICLNWGCIPTKALLRSSEIWHLLHRLN